MRGVLEPRVIERDRGARRLLELRTSAGFCEVINGHRLILDPHHEQVPISVHIFSRLLDESQLVKVGGDTLNRLGGNARSGH